MRIYWHNGSKNVIGAQIRALRTEAKLTQRQLASRLQLMGYEFDRLTIGRIETGDRFVADYEVMALAQALEVDINRLFDKISPISH